jgi:hypothetical protein
MMKKWLQSGACSPAAKARQVQKCSAIPKHRARPCLESLEERWAPAVFNVNSTGDILSPPPGVVTLRSAIETANATPGGNTINLTVPGTYQILLTGAQGEDDNAAGEFAIFPRAGNLSVVNSSGGTVIVDGNQLDRVFDIDPEDDAVNFAVTMQGFTIENGFAIASIADGPSAGGGGIRVQGSVDLTLFDMVITAAASRSKTRFSAATLF